MNKCPLSITVVGWLYVCVGCIALVAGVVKIIRPGSDASMLGSNYHDAVDLAFVSVSEIMAVAGGAFVLRGARWARWLCAVWMGAHVILSMLHTPVELVVHGLFFVAIVYVLFRPQASAYFRGTTMPIESSKDNQT